jgi:ribosomal protein L19E
MQPLFAPAPYNRASRRTYLQRQRRLERAVKQAARKERDEAMRAKMRDLRQQLETLRRQDRLEQPTSPSTAH